MPVSSENRIRTVKQLQPSIISGINGIVLHNLGMKHESLTHTSHEMCNGVCSAALTGLEQVFRDGRRCLAESVRGPLKTHIKSVVSISMLPGG